MKTMVESSQVIREVTVAGHWSEEDSNCFPAKGPKNSFLKAQLGENAAVKTRVSTIPVDQLNIKTRNEARLKAVLVNAPTASIVKDESKVSGDKVTLSLKFSIQEETICLQDSYKSQVVVSGTPYAAQGLLNDIEILPSGTHGVITDPVLLPSVFGRFEENSEFHVLKRLGKGGFGEVDLCQHKSGKAYVRKQISGHFKKKEVEVMALSHENITGCFGYIWRNGIHEILMEYGGLSLKVFVETQDWQAMLPIETLMRLAVQVFSALQYMHQYHILHLDIKPENLCIAYDSERNLNMKLTDFGTCQTPQQAVDDKGWTPEYMCPEACQHAMVSQRPDLASIFKNHELTGKSDVFAFGLTLYFMYEGSHAVLDIWKPNMKNYGNIRHQLIIFLAQSPNYICECVVAKERPHLLNELFRHCLAGDPQNRMTAEEAKTFIQETTPAVQVDFPNLPQPHSPSSPGSHSVDMSVDLSTCETEPSPMSPQTDESQFQEGRAGGGKDVKNHLREKLLRRQSTGPYVVDTARKLSSERSKVTNQDVTLPVFSVLLDD